MIPYLDLRQELQSLVQLMNLMLQTIVQSRHIALWLETSHKQRTFRDSREDFRLLV